MPRDLPQNQYALLTALAGESAPALLPDLAGKSGCDQSLLSAAAVELAEAGWVAVVETPFVELTLEDAGSAQLKAGDFPEFAITSILIEHGPLGLPAIAEKLGAPATEVGKALRFLFSKGLARKEKGTGDLAPLVTEIPGQESFDDIALLWRVQQSDGKLRLTAGESKKLTGTVAELKSRGFVKARERTERTYALTDAGSAVVKDGIEAKRERNQLEPEMLADGSWRDIKFRPYDVKAETAPAYPAKPHPLRRILERTRRAFHNLGFEEVRGSYVESAFWDFDALFQPQDHPAREMQDTFYVKRPGEFTLPDEKTVKTIQAVHENGGDTGSLGWGYDWSREEAQRVVLRTHTTAATIRALQDDPNPPRKVFVVGRVFRREKIDYKHLPEFHQVDGIIIDEKASLSHLLGTLAEFYRQMGFESVKFRPAFFPYTEPSVEVFVRMPGRDTDWFELGGSGVFRPEVTRPFGCTVPVLAWGLGLERLAMAVYGIKDIRQLYLSDARWLEETPLCL